MLCALLQGRGWSIKSQGEMLDQRSKCSKDLHGGESRCLTRMSLAVFAVEVVVPQEEEVAWHHLVASHSDDESSFRQMLSDQL